MFTDNYQSNEPELSVYSTYNWNYNINYWTLKMVYNVGCIAQITFVYVSIPTGDLYLEVKLLKQSKYMYIW